MKKLIFPLAFLFVVLIREYSFSQGIETKVKGSVISAQESGPLAFAAVTIMHSGDSAMVQGVMTDNKGSFIITEIPYGNYYLKIKYVGYDDFVSDVFTLSMAHPEKNFGIISQKISLNILRQVNVEDKQVRIEQKEDTIQYNAATYKTNPDATAEDLVKKMPGITTDNSGNVTAHGEQVKKVLVDGKPYFGEDPNMALKNMPADVVDKIQVFDQLSEQSQFTGFDDGQSTKTMNIVTRQARGNGQFGKFFAGYGTDDRYLAGGNFNHFKGDTRLSILGLANNINQQNFGTQDILGSSSGFTGRGGPPDRGGFPSGMAFGGSPVSSFMSGPQQGITTVYSAGINYSDNWGKKIKVSTSYFFNNTINDNTSELVRNYISAGENGLTYDENSRSSSKNNNHRANLRFEYSMDTLNKIILTSRFSYQQTSTNSSVIGENVFPENIMQSTSDNITTSSNSGYNTSNNLVYQHKFKKMGRTFSINLGADFNEKNGSGTLYSLSRYTSDTTLEDQHSTIDNNGYTLSSSINYTEPIDSSNQLQFSYSPSFTFNRIDKETGNYDLLYQDYSLLDTALSNKYHNNYISHRGGMLYRLNRKKFNFMAGLNFQYSTLSGDETFPRPYVVSKSFINILPQAMLNYKFSRGTNIRVIYRTSTNIPSISQLQNVVNNSNPLLLTTGNPDLKQNYEHTLIVRYGKTSMEKATGLFFFVFGRFVQDYIGNSTITAVNDTLINEGVTLMKGSQLSIPVNLNGYWNARTLFTYSLPVRKIKCNLNFNAGFTYNRTPARINEMTNIANNYNISAGTGITSNISEKIDFSLSYTGNYSIVRNSLQTRSNSNYFFHAASVRINWIFWKGFFVNTSFSNTLYDGLSQSYNQNYSLWNAALGYRFLKKQNLEVKAGVFDILDQNKSINRNVTDTYIEDNQSQVLNRYYMLTVTYTLRNYKGNIRQNFDRPPPPTDLDRPEPGRP